MKRENPTKTTVSNAAPCSKRTERERVRDTQQNIATQSRNTIHLLAFNTNEHLHECVNYRNEKRARKKMVLFLVCKVYAWVSSSLYAQKENLQKLKK